MSSRQLLTIDEADLARVGRQAPPPLEQQAVPVVRRIAVAIPCAPQVPIPLDHEVHLNDALPVAAEALAPLDPAIE